MSRKTMSDKPISYQPTDGLSYDPEAPLYWDKAGLDKELTRVFEVCNGCRMCFKFCDTFPDLFKLIDETHGGDVRGLTGGETRQVLDTCFQCKLCEVQCPYTPRDGHEYQLDFPKLVHRYRAQRTKTEGLGFGERILANPDLAGRVGTLTPGLANAANRTRIHRWFLEKTLGIHRDKLLPEFAPSTFDRWADTTGRMGKTEPGGDAVLFPTCYVQWNEPQVGRDTVEVMEKNQVDLRCTKGLRCCGMPSWEKGDLDSLRAQAKVNLDRLHPYVERGAKVVVINPTCSMMIRREYPELVATEDRERAKAVAAATNDASEFLWARRNEPSFSTDFKSSPGESIAYHAPCHLRAQAVGFKGRDLLKKIPGTQPETVLECCGHDGTYAMSVAGFEPSQRVGAKSFAEMKDVKAEVWATDCPLAALQFQQHAGKKPMHPMSILAQAYRGEPFPGVAPKGEDDAQG